MKDTHSSSDGGHSQATTEKDKGNQNAQAKKDHPEAPGPVIGMNDERGGVSVIRDLRGREFADDFGNRWDTKGDVS